VQTSDDQGVHVWYKALVTNDGPGRKRHPEQQYVVDVTVIRKKGKGTAVKQAATPHFDRVHCVQSVWSQNEQQMAGFDVVRCSQLPVPTLEKQEEFIRRKKPPWKHEGVREGWETVQNTHQTYLRKTKPKSRRFIQSTEVVRDETRD
jgi:hypothetical protein